jgi:hypothetical protein
VLKCAVSFVQLAITWKALWFVLYIFYILCGFVVTCEDKRHHGTSIFTSLSVRSLLRKYAPLRLLRPSRCKQRLALARLALGAAEQRLLRGLGRQSGCAERGVKTDYTDREVTESAGVGLVLKEECCVGAVVNSVNHLTIQCGREPGGT